MGLARETKSIGNRKNGIRVFVIYIYTLDHEILYFAIPILV